MKVMGNRYYSELTRQKERIEIRLKRQKDFIKVEYFDGIRICPDNLPKGKHMYQTRHSDTDISIPVSIAPEGTYITVNFCGTIVSDEPLVVNEETKLMYVSYL